MPKGRLPSPPPRKAFDSSLAIINIVLLLIFFFLATGSLLSSRTVEVALPETTRLPLDLLPSPLLVVATDGSMTLDGNPLDTGTLSVALGDSPILHVLADRDLPATTLLSTLDDEALIAVEVRLVTLHRNENEGEDSP
ncbi:biopolymer transporter ExbD [Tateyamaria sp. ANG-S1]|uniref:ExbD/TolR family protein n=1 Tax=Tateyamaria sp. ANG-S1 TaxID=1577905 RepID=UPI00068B59FA|nr:biopolymer transporter ExbD [Tateyamaria sp. ANG-S1]